MKPPLLDKRSRSDVLEQALDLAGVSPRYTPDWAAVASDEPGFRLLEIFSRLAEVLIDRLNRVPEKNFLSFLELAGVERFPGAPAQVPVTFLVAKRSPLGGIVPERTQVATTQTKTADAHVFETLRAFYATKARIERMVALHPRTDRFVIVPQLTIPPTAPSLSGVVPTAVLTNATGLSDIPHVFYVASSTLFGRKDVVNVSLSLRFVGPDVPRDVVWHRFDKASNAWVPLSGVSADYTVPNTVAYTFSSFAAVDKTVVDGKEDFWLALAFSEDFPTTASPPVLGEILGSISVSDVTTAGLDAAFYNSSRLDATKPFSPFGSRPRYGDALYLGSTAAFAPDNDSVTLRFTIRPYVDTDLQSQFDTLAEALTVRTLAVWQYLDATNQWVSLPGGTFDHSFTFAASTGAVTRSVPSAAGEGAFIGGSSGDTTAEVTFAVPGGIGLHTVNGVKSRWFRVLLMTENPYGHEGVVIGTGASTRFVGPLLIPPRVDAVTITYSPNSAFVERITRGKAFNNFEWADIDLLPGASPWVSVAAQQRGDVTVYGADPAVYVAFDRAFEPAAFISVFVDLAGPESSLSSPLETGNPNVAWEYWSETLGWRPLDVSDDALDLTTSGTVGFPAPTDAAPTTLFRQADPTAKADEKPRWWLRARLAGGRFDYPPRLRGVYVNSTMAENTSTVKTLLVGSSNAEPLQSFKLVKAPVLAGDLWVREMERPTETELRELESEHEADRVATSREPEPTVIEIAPVDGGDTEVWVRWRRVPNFELSGERSRHYLLEAVAGRVMFGGLGNGLIPPIGRDNLVLRGFQTGGGAKPNTEVGVLAVSELKTSLPFIDRVFNVQAASAGASEWKLDQLLEFGPQSLKTHDRSVTTEDYEWMILQRFSEIARVRCLPRSAPGPAGTVVFKAGGVTVLIVPRSTDARPQPSQGLIRKVRDFLRQKSLANIGRDIHVKGPEYVAVDVEAVLVATHPEMASVVQRQAHAAIEAFLHPLTGGEQHTGYDFGRNVFLSEVQAVLERLEHVDHVVSARFVSAPGVDVLEVPENYLASSGTHRITVLTVGVGT